MSARLPPIAGKLAAKRAIQKTGLEYTLFSTGWFLDYYGIPHIKSYLSPFTFVVDVANYAAAIPGDGNTKVTFTYTWDTAKFVAAAMDLEKWSETSWIVGDRKTYNEVLSLAEEVRGTSTHYYWLLLNSTNS